MMWSLLTRLLTDIMRRAINIIYRNQYSLSSLPNNVVLNCLAPVPTSNDPTLPCVSLSSLTNDVVSSCLARVPTSNDPTLACVSLSSLPNDVVLNCLSRVPTSYDPTLACVCKRFQSLVLSSELAQMRSLLAATKDYPLLCVFYTKSTSPGWKTFHWFTFNLKEKKPSPRKSVDISTTQNIATCPIVSIGSKIYFVGGSDYDAEFSTGLVIFDSGSSELSTGPSMKVARKGAGVAVVDGKIYVMGGCNEKEITQVEVFDPNTQTWEAGSLGPHGEVTYGNGLKRNEFREAVALDGRVYGMSFTPGYHTIYDTKDGTCENLEISSEYTFNIGKTCVVNSLIYVFYHDLGLMWYDSKEKMWRRVKGDLRCDHVGRHGMVECNGKLAFLWEESEEKNWCEMIVLDKVGVEIHGKVEWSEFVGSRPRYSHWSCLGLSL